MLLSNIPYKSISYLYHCLLLKYKWNVVVSTIDKILVIDVFNYQVSKENKEKVKSLVYEKLEKYFNILLIEIDVHNYDDSEFINAYLKKS